MKPILAFLVLGSLSSTALAQEPLPPPPAKTLGIDAMVVVPVGDYAEVVNVGLGALGRLEVPVGEGFVTGRAGVVFHLLDSRLDGSFTLIPLYGGYRHPVGDGGGYIAGELGITIGIASAQTSIGRVSDTETELGLTLMGGMRRGTFDVRAGLFAPDLGDAIGIAASVGFDFASF